MHHRNPYEVLEIPPDASEREVRDAFRLLAFVWHPDRLAGVPDLARLAARRFQAIHDAYRLLSHPAPGSPSSAAAATWTGATTRGRTTTRARATTRTRSASRAGVRARGETHVPRAFSPGIALLVGIAALLGLWLATPLTSRAEGRVASCALEEAPGLQPSSWREGSSPTGGAGSAVSSLYRIRGSLNPPRPIGDDGLSLTRPVHLGFYRPIR